MFMNFNRFQLILKMIEQKDLKFLKSNLGNLYNRFSNHYCSANVDHYKIIKLRLAIRVQ